MNKKELKNLKEFCNQNLFLVDDINSSEQRSVSDDYMEVDFNPVNFNPVSNFNFDNLLIEDNFKSDEIIDKIENNDQQVDKTFIINDVFEFINDELIEEEELEFIAQSSSNQQDIFLEQLTNLIISENPSSTFINKLLKSLKDTIFPECPLNINTLFKRYCKESENYRIYTRCSKCNSIINKNKKSLLSDKIICCEFCNNQMQWKEHSKVNLYTASFSIKEQLIKISEHVDLDQTDEIRLILTLDGIPLSISSSTSLYPLILYIENIKDKKLMDKLPIIKNLAIVNSDNKNSKPKDLSVDYELILTPLIDEFKVLEEHTFETKWSKRTVVKLKMFIADAPCRHDVCKFLRHNGTYPCLRCYVLFQKDKTTGEKKFPIPLSKDLDMRTIEHVLKSIEILKERSDLKHWYGVKGESLLLMIKEFNLLNDTIVDFMHAVLLGVYKNMLTGYFEQCNLKCYIDQNQMKVINERLKQLNPPSTFMRKLRPIDEFKNYKSLEFQNHLFYCCYFIFGNVLRTDFFNHLLLLSSATFKLWSKHTTDEQIEQAKVEIDKFLLGLTKLEYNDWFIKYNCHILVHLYEDRKKHGPLYYINQYSLEGLQQIYKGFLISKNKRVETLAKKAPLQIALNLNLLKNVNKSIKLTDNIEFIDQTDSQFLNQSYHQSIKDMILFGNCESRSLIVKSKYSKNIEDSYVKICDGYYKVHLFFEIRDQKKVLAKRIPIKKCVTRTIGYVEPPFTFEINQLKIIDDEFFEKDGSLFVYNCDQIERKVFYVKINELRNQYIVDVEN